MIAGLIQDRAGVDTAKVPVIVMGPGEITASTSREIQRLDEAQALAAKTR